MSQQLITRYLNELSDLRRVSGEVRESVVREAFKTLLKDWGHLQNLIFVPEYRVDTTAKERRYVDGALLYELRVPFGYWESKDEKDDLEAEIALKFRRGYPQDNIIFEDSRQAVLIQNKAEVMRCGVDDTTKLAQLVSFFFGYERKEISDFRKAVEQFKVDLPEVLRALRTMIGTAEKKNAAFGTASAKFLKHAQETINPSVTSGDVREMLIQHVLTEDIFSHVFDSADFHRQNNIAGKLYKLEATFFTGAVKRNTLDSLRPYYAAIRSAAALVSSHHEKQSFLKAIYENFYRVYNPKAADRLGVVYTPNEIVRFMIDGADWLCIKHFGRNLIDKNVEILDPATGTGTFICELIEHFRGQPKKLAHKYLEELHANEVGILPYYVANLNIEATYAAIRGGFEEFQNLCFVDTLDNTAGLGIRAGHQHDLFGAMSDENVLRIKRQNHRKISVVIGNPPYNANQVSENDNNKNRTYPRIDESIKSTYIAKSTAQKTKVYDMYARFFRWATDRLHDDGILAFVTNRSFIESRTFDGFRKSIASEFSQILVVDLGGDVRSNPKLSGTKNNVFGIQTGVAISFLVKDSKAKGKSNIGYARRPEMETAEEKLVYLSTNCLSSISFESIKPDAKGSWLEISDNDWETLIPVCDKAVKSKKIGPEKAIFKLFSLGVVTARDSWVYDFDEDHLARKVNRLIDVYNKERARVAKVATKRSALPELDNTIKWTRALKKDLKANVKYIFDKECIKPSLYRPFFRPYLYFNKSLNEMQYQLNAMFRGGKQNPTIAFLSVFSTNPLAALAVDQPFDYCFLKQGNGGTQSLPRYRYGADGKRVDNITDWSLNQFTAQYKGMRLDAGAKPPKITKDAIFDYVYAVLHDPHYRKKYAQNLKRDYPRIPYYPDFWTWANYGKKLFEIHVGFDDIDEYPVRRIDKKDKGSEAAGLQPKTILRAHPDDGVIVVDSVTTLSDIPEEAWSYRLANRTVIEWVLDAYKEKTPKDATIKEEFNTYQFADYKEEVIILLSKVIQLSVDTVEITDALAAASPLKPMKTAKTKAG
jgi:predicted helicase